MSRAYPVDLEAESEWREVIVLSETEEDESFVRGTNFGLTRGWPAICTGARLPAAGAAAPPTERPEAPDAGAGPPLAGRGEALELNDFEAAAAAPDDAEAVEVVFVAAGATTDDREAVDDFGPAGADPDDPEAVEGRGEGVF